MDIVKNIGPAMARRRKELGISLEEVASRAGTSKSHIWDLEKGNSVNPTITMLLAVAMALNTSINTLLGTDISQPIISDDELELIQHHRRIFGRHSDSKKFANDCLILKAEIEHLEMALGESLSDEDAAMVRQIEDDAEAFLQSEIASKTTPDTAEAYRWRYEIKQGPDGESHYAWVYFGHEVVATMKTHHAIRIVEALRLNGCARASLSHTEEIGR